jgi:ABC-type sulfate transport system permease component
VFLELRSKITLGFAVAYLCLTAVGLTFGYLSNDDTGSHLIKELLLLPLFVPASVVGLFTTPTSAHAAVLAFKWYYPVSFGVVLLCGYVVGRAIDR